MQLPFSYLSVKKYCPASDILHQILVFWHINFLVSVIKCLPKVIFAHSLRLQSITAGRREWWLDTFHLHRVLSAGLGQLLLLCSPEPSLCDAVPMFRIALSSQPLPGKPPLTQMCVSMLILGGSS